MTVSMIVSCALTLTVLIASVTDLKTGEIPHWLVYGSLTAGVVFQIITRGFHVFVPVLLAILTGFGLSFIGFWVGQFGAGDVKLYMALSAWAGTATMAWSIWLYSSIAGGIIGLAMLLGTRTGRRKLVHGWMTLILRFTPKTRRQGRLEAIEVDESPFVMKYAPAIAIGTFALIWLGGVAL